MNPKIKQDFPEAVKVQLLDLTPPQEDVLLTDPWSLPIRTCMWGMALSAIHINNFYLDYIGNTLGVLLIYLGLRSLRDAGNAFRSAWAASLVLLILNTASLGIGVLPLSLDESYTILYGGLYAITTFVLLLLFRAGVTKVFRDAGQKPERDPLLFAALWYALMIFCALTPLGQLFPVALLMVALYILILRSIFKLPATLNRVGYRLVNAPVRIPGKALAMGYIALCLLLVFGGSFLANHQVPESTAFTPPARGEDYTALAELGAPEETLDWLTEEQLAILQETVAVETNEQKTSMQPGEFYVNDFLTWSNVAFWQPDGTAYVAMSYRWAEGASYWNDGFVMYGSQGIRLVGGKLFWEEDGESVQAAMPRLRNEWVVANSFMGSESYEAILGGMTYPLGSANQGGLVLYQWIPNERIDLFTLFDFNHRLSPVQLPYCQPEDEILQGGINPIILSVNFWGPGEDNL